MSHMSNLDIHRQNEEKNNLTALTVRGLIVLLGKISDKGEKTAVLDKPVLLAVDEEGNGYSKLYLEGIDHDGEALTFFPVMPRADREEVL